MKEQTTRVALAYEWAIARMAISDCVSFYVEQAVKDGVLREVMRGAHDPACVIQAFASGHLRPREDS